MSDFAPTSIFKVLESEDLDLDAAWENDDGSHRQCSSGHLVIRTARGAAPALVDTVGIPQGGPDHWVRFHVAQATIGAADYYGPIVIEVVLTDTGGNVKSLGVEDGIWERGVAT